MSDKEFLNWLYDRIIYVYEDDEDMKNEDFMIRFKEIINGWGD